jgi:hypothetical protein
VAPRRPPPEIPPGFEPPVAPLPTPAVPPGFLPRADTTAAPPAVIDGPPPRTWPASPVAYVQWEVGARAAGTRDTLGAALRREVGAAAAGTRDAPGAALCREAGAGAQATCGGPGAALSQEAGTTPLPPLLRPSVGSQGVVVSVMPPDNPHRMITRGKTASGWCLIVLSSPPRPLHRHRPRSPPPLVLRLPIPIDVRLWRKSTES